jgi:hypothetical protein
MPLLSHYSVKVLRGELPLLECPVLLWRSAPMQPAARVLKTLAAEKSPRPSQADPVVLEIKKGTHSGNAFSMGVTLGRVESNDLWIEDESVSRFHAYFQQAKGRSGPEWRLVDAESMNGSFLGADRLTPNLPQRVKNGALLRFGDVEVEFYEPGGFRRLLETLPR